MTKKQYLRGGKRECRFLVISAISQQYQWNAFFRNDKNKRGQKRNNTRYCKAKKKRQQAEKEEVN